MNTSTFKNLNQCWAELAVEELVRSGVELFCISPGSRSTPLTIAAARNSRAKTEIFIDERNAAFFAVGYARSAGQPAALICTSGTAGANYYPAVIEAFMDALPIIIMTADRPPELQNTGTNQTIDQTNLFGKYAKGFFPIPCPAEDIPPEFILSAIDQAVSISCTGTAGPVHLNFMLREPLIPTTQLFKKSYTSSIRSWFNVKPPFSCPSRKNPSLKKEPLAVIRSSILSSKKGLLLVGRLKSEKESTAVKKLASLLQWPVWADIQSGLRLGPRHPCLVETFSFMAQNPNLKSKLKPDYILHLGGGFTSKQVYEFLKSLQGISYDMVNPSALPQDPLKMLNMQMEAELPVFCRQITDSIKTIRHSQLLRTCLKVNKASGHKLNFLLTNSQRLSEPLVAKIVSEEISKGRGLFLGNSMPIRDMDDFGTSGGKPVYVKANRGVSGIDGILASACGFAAGLRKPVVLMTGDLSLLHNLNALQTAAGSTFPVIIVAINNQGGGIFSLLPVAAVKDVFEEFFATPHHICFENAARMFGLGYMRPSLPADFRSAFRDALMLGRSVLIEVMTDRKLNQVLHNTLKKQLTSPA